MDKFFLLTYTCIGYDGLRHMGHAWFENEEDMKAFVKSSEQEEKGLEVDLAIEILSHREIIL